MVRAISKIASDFKSDPLAISNRSGLSSGTDIQKNSRFRRLELSLSKNTPHGGWGQGPSSVGKRFLAGLPFPVPEILEFVAFRESGKFLQQFSRDFPGVFPREPPNRPRKQPQPSRVF